MAGQLFDTNIVIDALNRHDRAIAVLKDARIVVISRISWIEVLAGARPAVRDATAAVMRGFDVIELDAAIAERAAEIRHATRLKLPDAIILATALTTGRTLFTTDRRLAAGAADGVVPY